MAAAHLIDRATRSIRSSIQPHRAAPTAFRHVMVHDADGERRSALPRGSSPTIRACTADRYRVATVSLLGGVAQRLSACPLGMKGAAGICQ